MIKSTCVSIICDNNYLFDNINEILSKYEVEFCLFYSPRSPLSDDRKRNSTLIDLKSKGHVSNLINRSSLVLSCHCMQIFPNDLVDSVRCYNLHPGYNPFNRGWYPQVFAIINNTTIGATLHEIDNFLDHGKIIDQEVVKIDDGDTSLSVYQRVQEVEISILRRNIKGLIENTYSSEYPSEEGKVNLKKDFNSLLALDLDNVGTLEDHIKLLRALTHPPYWNAFYKDEEGRKIYVRIETRKE